MVICGICGKEVQKINYGHLKSKEHLNAVKKLELAKLKDIDNTDTKVIIKSAIQKKREILENPNIEYDDKLKLLEEHLDKIQQLLKQNQITEVKESDIISKKLKIFRSYILYFYSDTNLQARLIPFPSIKPVIRLKSTLEIFKINKPAFFMDGKPVFILFREKPFSIEFETVMRELTEYEIKELDDLGYTKEQIEKIGTNITVMEKKYSASDIDSMLYSAHSNILLRQKKISIQFGITWIFSILSTVLITYIVLSNIYNFTGV